MKEDGCFLIVELSVDELCANGKPNTTFWFYCIKNNYLEYREKEKRYYSRVDYVHLIPSENQAKNEYVVNMFEEMDISAYF